MRVQCDACESFVEVARLAAVPGGVGFRCAMCGEVNRIDAEEAPAPSAPAESPAPDAAPVVPPSPDGPATPPAPDDGARVVCPKCGHAQDDERACHRCGLVFARYAGAGVVIDPLAGHPAGRAIRARWEALRDQLDDTQGHHDFIQLCVEQNLLEYAGMCYRKLTPHGTLEDQRVARYRERVVKAALVRIATVEGRRTEQLGTRLRGLIILTFVALIFLAFAVGYWILSRTQAPA